MENSDITNIYREKSTNCSISCVFPTPSHSGYDSQPYSVEWKGPENHKVRYNLFIDLIKLCHVIV